MHHPTGFKKGKRFFKRAYAISTAVAPFAWLAALAVLTVTAGNLPGAASTWGDFVEPGFPFFASSLDARKLGKGLPPDNLTARGLILNLGSNCWACFDTDLLRMAVVWVGQGVSPVSMAQISYHAAGVKAVEGEEHLPQPLGDPLIATGLYGGWQVGTNAVLRDPREPSPDPKESGRGPLPAALGRFSGIRLTNGILRLEYEIETIQIQESVEAQVFDGQTKIRRHFHLNRVPRPLFLVLGRKPDSPTSPLTLELSMDTAESSTVEEIEQDGVILIRVNPSIQPVSFRVAIGSGKRARVKEPIDAGTVKGLSSKAHWPEILHTHGNLSTARNAYVTDNIPLPFENPWKRNIRLVDLAFFRNGRAAAVTFDGDVWIVEGLNGDLHDVQWKRYASGFQEPMGITIRNDELFVCDRNGIWRMHDTNGNEEADFYEMFSNAYGQTAETREYAHGIRAAPDGSFVIAKGGIQMSALGKDNGKILRISPDGRSSSMIGYGFRSPFIGVHPRTGLVTASDQQGNYVPTTPLHIVRDQQFYGFLSSLQPREHYPAQIAEPLTWIPYPVNASGAGQVWLTGANMGPLNDTLIHIAYYRPEIFAVLINHRTVPPQGGVVSITRDLEFSPLNGALNPVDGQLYVTGFQIFGTAAKQISGLARLHYTGATSTLPREVVATDKGFLIRFDTALNPKQAVNPENFSSERWNYARTAAYGSSHFKLDGTKGQEALRASSAYLSRDGKSIFVGIPDMKPSMQIRIGWALQTQEGTRFEQNAYLTPRELTRFDAEAEGFPPLTIELTPTRSPAAFSPPITADEGRRISELMGCSVCHSTDGTTLGKTGPTWKGLFETEQTLADGTKVTATEAYLRESIREPAAKLVRGYEKSETAMPSYDGVLTEAQIEALILYIKTLKQDL